MRFLHVQQTQLAYVAVLERPAFPLWANFPGILSGLYHAFDGLHSGLTDLAVEGDGRDPLSRSVVVTLGRQGFFTVGYDRLEAEMSEYNSDDLAAFPGTLARGDWWLRTHWSGAVVQAHYLTFSTHGTLDEGSTAEYLNGFSAADLGIGDSLGTGLIFHAMFPGTNWQVHLTLDHSSVVEGGLFVQYVVTIGEDRIDYSQALDTSLSFLHSATTNIGLRTGIGSVG